MTYLVGSFLYARRDVMKTAKGRWLGTETLSRPVCSPWKPVNTVTVSWTLSSKFCSLCILLDQRSRSRGRLLCVVQSAPVICTYLLCWLWHAASRTTRTTASTSWPFKKVSGNFSSTFRTVSNPRALPLVSAKSRTAREHSQCLGFDNQAYLSNTAAVAI